MKMKWTIFIMAIGAGEGERADGSFVCRPASQRSIMAMKKKQAGKAQTKTNSGRLLAQ